VILDAATRRRVARKMGARATRTLKKNMLSLQEDVEMTFFILLKLLQHTKQGTIDNEPCFFLMGV